ncbi:MAG: DegT/DnrJ/EryC1/StrS family aminotransferase [Armatimonadota bacterium]
MKVPMADIRAQHHSIKSEIDTAVQAVMDKCVFILGDNVRAIESEIAEYSGSSYGIGVASGTDAIALALRALDVQPGDEVITTPFTFVATTEVIALMGAIPVYADIDPRTFNLDPDKIEEKITSKTKVILPVHLYGQCADVERISGIAKKHNLKVVWDAAQAIGAESYGRGIGEYADAVTLSFYPAKNLGCAGDGGMVLTNDSEILEKLKYLRFHGSGGTYSYKYVGYCSRLDEIQAAVLRAKLPHLNDWTKKRQDNADIYNREFAGLDMELPYVAPYNKHTFYQYTVRCANRDALKNYLAEYEIGTGVYYPGPLHLEEAYRYLNYSPGDFPVTELACDEVLSLPIFPEITDDQLAHVVKTVKSFFK